MIQNLEAGILLSSSSLVLQRVSRSSSGLYTCTASNIEGDTDSRALELSVKCKSETYFYYFLTI